eukprot:gene9454-9534_t
MIGTGMTGKSAYKSVLVFGGTRSGKSAYALQLAENSGLAPLMIATAQIHDDEMRARIEAHRLERGPHWSLIEEPLHLLATLQREASPDKMILVDCLTLWLSNVMFEEQDYGEASHALAQFMQDLGGPVIFVSNELGLGTVPDHALTRRFRDAQAMLFMCRPDCRASSSPLPL